MCWKAKENMDLICKLPLDCMYYIKKNKLSAMLTVLFYCKYYSNSWNFVLHVGVMFDPDNHPQLRLCYQLSGDCADR